MTAPATPALSAEGKSKLTEEHIDRHVQRMKKLKRMLPAYRHHQAFGAVAALVVPDHVAQYAQQQGFYVPAQSGDTVEVRSIEAKYKTHENDLDKLLPTL